MYAFNSASRQYHEVWVSQFPFLYGLKDVVPPGEACLYGCLNWSLRIETSPGGKDLLVVMSLPVLMMLGRGGHGCQHS